MLTTLTKSEPWHLDDRQWFKDFPEKDWRLRDLFPDELDSFLPPVGFETAASRTKDAIQTLESVGHIVQIQVFVLRIDDGKRIRLPVIRNPQGSPKEFSFVVLDDLSGMDADEVVAWLRQSVPRTTTGPQPNLEQCPVCGKNFRHGDVCCVLSGLGPVCPTCVSQKNAGGVCGFSIFTTSGPWTPSDKKRLKKAQKIIKRMHALGAFKKSKADLPQESLRQTAQRTGTLPVIPKKDDGRLH